MLGGDCGEALVVGVHALLGPMNFINCCAARMLSVDARCKTFDAAANGYVRGEGCGAVVLTVSATEVSPPDRSLSPHGAGVEWREWRE